MDELGVAALSEAELLAILLGGKQPARAEALAELLLADGLGRLGRLRPGPHTLHPWLERVQAERVCAALELGRRAALHAAPERGRLLHPGAICALIAPRIAHLDHEQFWAVLLTARLEEIRTVRISSGGVTHCSILPREALAPAVLHAAPCVVFAHNHPSGDPEPSTNDQRLQLLLDEAGRALGIHVADHLVITDRCHHSAREGFLSFTGEPIPEPIPDAADGLGGRQIAFMEVPQ